MSVLTERTALSFWLLLCRNSNKVSTSWNGYDGYGYVMVSAGFETLTNPAECMISNADMKAMLIASGFEAVDYPKYTGKFVTAELVLD